MSLSYSYNEISSPADWLELDYYSEDEDMVIDHISLYSTATGEELTGFQQHGYPWQQNWHLRLAV